MRSLSKKHTYYGTEYRSKFEVSVAKSLRKRKMKFSYESVSYPYRERLKQAKCANCGCSESYTNHWYTPDFFLDNGIIVEAKGLFTTGNRKTMLAVQEQHLDLDLRLLFMRNNKIHRKSKMRYVDWAENNGFICAVGEIPKDWLNKGEKP